MNICLCFSVTISEDLVITLVITESTLDDGGVYTIRVFNEHGEAVSSAEVVIIFEAPTFLQPLTDILVTVEQPARFTATVHGVPQPDITWLVSGMEVTESERYHIEQYGETVSFTVNRVTVDDTELVYTCRASSPVGEATSSGRFVLPGIL